MRQNINKARDLARRHGWRYGWRHLGTQRLIHGDDIIQCDGIRRRKRQACRQAVVYPTQCSQLKMFQQWLFEWWSFRLGSCGRFGERCRGDELTEGLAPYQQRREITNINPCRNGDVEIGEGLDRPNINRARLIARKVISSTNAGVR